MIALRAERIEKSYGVHTVLAGVSISIAEHERIGIVGANGTGKSTLLRILAGERPDAGRVSREKTVRVALLEQELSELEATAWDAALAGAHEIMNWRRRWTTLTEHLQREPHRSDLLEEAGEIQDRLAHLDGFTLDAQAQRVLRGLGLAEPLWSRPVRTLSGGERTRVNLARALLASPDVLLLDEPTTHLDVDALEWLEDFLRSFRGAVVLVSHDRRFLDRTVTRIAELAEGRITEFPGNYSAYRAMRAQQLTAQEGAYAQHREEVARLQEFVRRQLQWAAEIGSGPKRGRDHYGRVARKVARGALGSRKRIVRLEAKAPPKPRRDDTIHLSLERADRTGPALGQLREVTVRFDSTTVLDGASLTLGRDDRVGLVGPNGSGRTTLLRLLAGELHPSAGEVWIGPGVRVGYLPQGAQGPDDDRRVIDAALDLGLDPALVRGVLAGLLFRGDRVFQAVRDLSSGERTRLALLELLARKSNLLLLDEPTNHLDLPSRERLEETLDAYSGALVLASHDRFLLDRLCTTIWAIEGKQVRAYEGTFSDVSAHRGNQK